MEQFYAKNLINVVPSDSAENLDDLMPFVSPRWPEALFLRESVTSLEKLLLTQKYNRSEDIWIQLHNAIQYTRSQVSFLILCNLVEDSASILHNKDMKWTIDKLIQQAAIINSDTVTFSESVKYIESVRNSMNILNYQTGLLPSRKLPTRHPLRKQWNA